MVEPTLCRLVTKLKRRCRLDAQDEQALLSLPFLIRSLDPGGFLVRQGEPADSICVLLSGFAYRQKIVGSGGRQILALQVPGDAVDVPSSLLKIADHSIQALSAVAMACIPRTDFMAIIADRPAVAKAFWLDTLVDGAIAWEWIVNIGRRNALMRLAHLLCECELRLDVVGLIAGQPPTLSMTQEQIGDALGLTQVHINRMLRRLEDDGLIARDHRAIAILDVPKLYEVADFQPAYLHLDLLDD